MKRNVLAIALLLVLVVATTLVIKSRFQGPPTEIAVRNTSNQLLTVSLGPDPLGQPIQPGAIYSAPFVSGMSVRIWVGPKAEGLPGEWIIDDVRGTIDIQLDGSAVQITAEGLESRPVPGS
ncbi:MAG: hypothetical protein PSX37_09300 [bacterium]|nr:hypothetical protein [bacterium]